MTRQPHDRGRSAAAVVVLVLMALWLLTIQRDRDTLADQLDQALANQDRLAQGFAVLQGQVETLGGEPAVELEEGDMGPTPVEVPGPQGPQGPGPSDDQIAVAVERYCAANGCMGPAGPAPSALQVAEAVASYCDARGECRGDAGTAGTPGETGATGPQGPGPTDGQIATAVESYCSAHDGCRGPAGTDGQQGETGPPGPTCPDGADPVTWTVDDPHAAIIGIDAGTYVICRAGV